MMTSNTVFITAIRRKFPPTVIDVQQCQTPPKPQSTFTTALSIRFMVTVCDFMSCCNISDLLTRFSCHPKWGQLLQVTTDIAGMSSWGTRYTNSVYLKHISSLIPIAIVAFAIILVFTMILWFAVGIIFAMKLITLDRQSAVFFLHSWFFWLFLWRCYFTSFASR